MRLYSIKEINFQEWEEYWKNCKHTNMLQSWQYGDAKQMVGNWKPYRFVLINKNGENISLAQVLVKKLPFLVSIARVNRGPLIIGDILKQVDRELMVINSIAQLIVESKNRGWRMLQIAPEIKNTKVVISKLKYLGLRKLSRPPWSSGLLSTC